MKKIVITGATGQLGNQVLKFLTEKIDAEAITAIARDVNKLSEFKKMGVNVVYADYDDKASLLKAFDGQDLLYFVSANDVLKRDKQHENVVSAAVETSIKHVFYTSFQRKDESPNSPIAPIAAVHLQTERWLKESGLVYTILKHALYTEGLPMFLGDKIAETGMVYLPAEDGKAAFATRTDMAEVASIVLTTDGHENKSYEISTNQSVSFTDIAGYLSDIFGKEVKYVSPAVTEYKEILKKAGVPEGMIGFSLLFTEGIKQGEFDIPDPTLEKLLGRKPERVADYLKRLYLK